MDGSLPTRVTKGGRTVKYKPTPHRVADLVMNNVRNFEVSTEPAYANRWSGELHSFSPTRG